MKRRKWSNEQKLKIVLEDLFDQIKISIPCSNTWFPKPSITVGKSNDYNMVTRPLKRKTSGKWKPKSKTDRQWDDHGRLTESLFYRWESSCFRRNDRSPKIGPWECKNIGRRIICFGYEDWHHSYRRTWFFNVAENIIEPLEFIEKLKNSGILFGPPKGLDKEIRVVIHEDVSKEDILEMIKNV